jgi:DNA end-binding protein Ku
VQMEPARTAQETISFHTVNRQTGNRVESRYVDAETGEPVEGDNQVKGYELDDETYVMIEDDELEAVALESARTIDIERFAPAEDVGWIWLDRPHFLRPADKIGAEAFAVIREAMAATGTAALARLVLYRREHAVVLLPRDKGIVLWTLRYADEIRPAEPAPGKADAKTTRLLGKLIEDRTQAWSPDLVSDPVQENLEKIIAGKKSKAKKTAPKRTEAPKPTDDNVVSIMDALKRSVAAGKKGR